MVGLLSLPVAAQADSGEKVLIRASKPYTTLVATIEALGGKVSYQYKNVDAIAAEIPREALGIIRGMVAPNAITKDSIVPNPAPVDLLLGKERFVQGSGAEPLEAEDVQVLQGEELSRFVADLPANFNFNNNLTGAAGLHALGKLGQGVIVGVIDTGTANNAAVVPAVAGTVIGGENFVAADPVQSATSTFNDPHGTWVGSMIAAHANFVFLTGSNFVQSLNIHAPGSVFPFPGLPFLSIVPMFGTAPAANIYALKVFDSRGGGAPESRIIAAMDRAITLRRNFNNGVPSVPVSGDGSEDNPFVFDSLDIEIVNMSLGGPTLFAGRDLEDQLTLGMLEVGITLAASAGNDGFPAITGGSPGTGIGTLTVGAASTSVHERVLRDLQFGVGIGALFRPFTPHQMAFFSSRGPTADGRLDPDVVANGFASFAQGAGGGLAVVSGTSFSSPTAAGAAALLRGEVPWASAAQIRNALIASADPSVLGDGSGPIDQGSGFINVPAALALLEAGGVTSEVLPDQGPNNGVRQNLDRLGLDTVNFRGDIFSTHVENLLPGQVAHFFVRSRTDTDRLVVRLRNISPELAPGQQNVFFGDDIFLRIQDAPTSFDRRPVSAFVGADSAFPIDNPQSGLVRVAVMGDWTNAGRISVDLEIEQQRDPQTPQTGNGQVAEGDLVPVQVNVPAGTAQLVFELFWAEDWASYPTNDIDLFLVDLTTGAVDFSGASLNSPERVVIDNPTAGPWLALISGFTVFGEKDNFVLRATADGVRLRGN